MDGAGGRSFAGGGSAFNGCGSGAKRGSAFGGGSGSDKRLKVRLGRAGEFPEMQVKFRMFNATTLVIEAPGISTPILCLRHTTPCMPWTKKDK
jgi:hypothetical protein